MTNSVPNTPSQHTAGWLYARNPPDQRLSFALLGNAAVQVGAAVDLCAY
jgi:hypothetical protein